ncbi:hypothetical protein D3C75_549750 [compost metagenome]
MGERHSDNIGSVSVQNNTVICINLQTFNMAHEMGSQLACRYSVVAQTPQHFNALTCSGYAQYAQVSFRVFDHVAEVFTGTCHDEVFACKLSYRKSKLNRAQRLTDINVLSHFFFVQQVADVTAVQLIPAQGPHVMGDFRHFLDKRGFGSGNIAFSFNNGRAHILSLL